MKNTPGIAPKHAKYERLKRLFWKILTESLCSSIYNNFIHRKVANNVQNKEKKKEMLKDYIRLIYMS